MSPSPLPAPSVPHCYTLPSNIALLHTAIQYRTAIQPAVPTLLHITVHTHWERVWTSHNSHHCLLKRSIARTLSDTVNCDLDLTCTIPTIAFTQSPIPNCVLTQLQSTHVRPCVELRLRWHLLHCFERVCCGQAQVVVAMSTENHWLSSRSYFWYILDQISYQLSILCGGYISYCVRHIERRCTSRHHSCVHLPIHAVMI